MNEHSERSDVLSSAPSSATSAASRSPVCANRLIRFVTIGLTLGGTLIGTFFYCQSLGDPHQVNVLQWASVPLFSILFGWITFSFCQASLGFIALLSDRIHGRARKLDCQHMAIQTATTQTPTSRPTAILMPVYNESPTRVFAGVQAMIHSLRQCAATGQKDCLQQFEFYILSDTTESEIWLQEEAAWAELVKQEPDARVFYRHRPQNHSRKAGNIADFCSRWGGKHPYMIILDADSLMTGETMVQMVRRMDADPSLGILQVPPTPIGRQSLFARMQQFAAAAYGPLFVRGFDTLAGNDGNYWGHNAILRMKPFVDHCHLPVLPGAAPLGGEILSHDFVEAALMLRGGWKVRLATDLTGSYEECPTTLTDYAIRDQRWCQGNLQHSRLALSKGFSLLSRWHFVSGVMAYAASPLWILMTILCVAGTALQMSQPSTPTAFPRFPIAVCLFAVSMVMLLLPKAMSLFVVSLDGEHRKRFGGLGRLWISGLMEVVASVLLSPIMSLHHTRFVIGTLTGKSVRWSAQQRDEHSVNWSEAARDYAWMTGVGITATAVLAIGFPAMLVWFSPLLVGLLFSIPLAVAFGSGSWGWTLRRWNLLTTPAESEPPKVATDQQMLIGLSASRSHPAQSFETLLDAVIRDPMLFALHYDIQRQSAVDQPLPVSQSKAIEAAWSAGGAKRIPEKLRGPLLNDLATMQALHIESQLASVQSARQNRPIETVAAAT